jgi:guanidinoacetate N-methyltransferase
MMKEKKFADVRETTYQSRCDIGFLPDYHMWKDEQATFTNDELVIQGHPVMERWEDSYMKELADIAASQGGIVLEVGFGMGISAEYIQMHDIENHMIIEANDDVFVALMRFAKESARPITPLHGFWQEITSTIPDGTLSGILFDTYPLTKEEVHQNHFSFFHEAYRMLKKGGVLTYYSDEIDGFSEAHLSKLREAGFTNIQKKVCPVTPPAECQYWKSSTIVAPIITK